MTCPRCESEQPTDNFYTKEMNGLRVKTHSYCRTCVLDQTTSRQQALKQLIVDYKGGKCLECQYVGPNIMYDLHHRDPTQKDFAVSRCKATKWNDEIRREVDKCDLLCAICHRTKHSVRAVVRDSTGAEKICKLCGKGRLRTEFYKRHNRPSTTSLCKYCFNVKAIERQGKLREELIESRGSECMKCKRKGAAVIFDFHHRDREKKTLSISNRTNRSQDFMRKEADKCDMLCVFCHRLEHW